MACDEASWKQNLVWHTSDAHSGRNKHVWAMSITEIYKLAGSELSDWYHGMHVTYVLREVVKQKRGTNNMIMMTFLVTNSTWTAVKFHEPLSLFSRVIWSTTADREWFRARHTWKNTYLLLSQCCVCRCHSIAGCQGICRYSDDQVCAYIYIIYIHGISTCRVDLYLWSKGVISFFINHCSVFERLNHMAAI